MATPHLGGTTIESEANCAVMAAQEMDDYLRNGNIRNSVNMPTLVLERSGKVRICVIHRNLPGMLTTIMPIFARDGVNIENMTNKVRRSIRLFRLRCQQRHLPGGGREDPEGGGRAPRPGAGVTPVRRVK